jgi:hypothetical protein
MLRISPAAMMGLNSRVDVMSIQPAASAVYRTASYDRAGSWQCPWTPWVVLNPPISPAANVLLATDIGRCVGAAAAMSGDGRVMHLCTGPNDVQPGPYLYQRSEDFSHTWIGEWSAIGDGVFTTSPAIATSGDGQTIVVAGVGTDNRVWIAISTTSGNSWDVAWDPIPSGTFAQFAPAIACSADGTRVFAFGVGDDQRIWYAWSNSGGSVWDMAWAPINNSKFSSAPAAMVSADGRKVYVFGRGLDNHMYFIQSTDGAASWDGDWSAIPAGANFQSGPGACTSWDGVTVNVFALGGNNAVWRAQSVSGGAHWETAWAQVGELTF